MDGVRVKEEVLSEDDFADDTTTASDKHANPNHCMNWIKAEPLEAEAVTEYSDYPPEEDNASEGYHNKKEEQLVSVEMEEIVTVKMEDEEGDVVAQVDASHINGGITETYVCRVCGMIFTTWLNLIDHTKDCGVKKNTTTSIVNHHPTPIAVNANLHANAAPIVVYPATQVFVVSPGMMFKQNNGLPMLFKSEGSVFEASGMPSILKRESPVLQIPHMPTTLPQRPVVIAPMGNGSPPANNTLEKQFKCPKCSFSTSRAFNLKRHITIHNDASQPKAYKCTYCPYSSNLTHHLRIHMRTHTGEKPYRCTICPYAATQVANLTRHIRKHTGEKPYKCEYCPYACAHSSDLKRHIRIHTLEKPFECKLCHRRFTVGGNLKSHMKTHTGEKPYKCTLCPYACASSSNLKIHIRKHNEGQPNPVVIDEHMAALVGATALENQSEAVTAAG